MKTSHDGDTLGGPEAQTGNLVHGAMAAFHAAKKLPLEKRVIAAVKAMKELHKKTYIGGDLATAEVLFQSWYRREVSIPKGEVVGSEIELRYKIPIFYNAADYQTYRKAWKKLFASNKINGNAGLPIPEEEAEVTGHVDEIRRLDDVAYICDEKTGNTPSEKMRGGHVAQVAGYMVGIHKLNLLPGVTKLKGFIKRTRDIGNFSSSSPYYYEILSNIEQAYEMIFVVGLRLGELAQGATVHIPGEHCKWCPMATYPDCLSGKIDVVKQLDKKRKALPVLGNAGKSTGGKLNGKNATGSNAGASKTFGSNIRPTKTF